MSKIIALPLGFANAYIVRDRDAILIDTGTNVSKEEFRELFFNLGIAPTEIKLIIISHGHTDHFAQVYELKEITGAPVLCHKNAIHALQTGQNSEIIPRNTLGENVWKAIEGNLPKVSKPVTPDLVMDSTFDLTPYGVAGKIIHTPGHSNCSIAVVLDSGEAIVGDMLVPSPLTGEPCAAYFASNEKALFENIQKLLAKAHTFYGGHGRAFSKEEVLKLMPVTTKK